jgi:hypothetical protein
MGISGRRAAALRAQVVPSWQKRNSNARSFYSNHATHTDTRFRAVGCALEICNRKRVKSKLETGNLCRHAD